MRRRTGRAPRGLRHWKGVRRTSAAVTPFLALGAAAQSAVAQDTIYPTLNYDHVCIDGTLQNPKGYCQTDNTQLTAWLEGSLLPNGMSNIRGVLNNQINPTTLDVRYPSSPTYSGSAETDIIFQQGGGLPDNKDGFVWCNNAITQKRCDQHYARFLSSAPDEELSCHEIGHAVGLTHGEDAYPAVGNNDNSLGCMQRDIPIDNNGRLGALNLSNINNTYPPGAGPSSDPYKE